MSRNCLLKYLVQPYRALHRYITHNLFALAPPPPPPLDRSSSAPKTMISDKVYNLVHAQETVSSELAKHPTESPGKIAARLYGPEGGTRTAPLRQPARPEDVTPEDLKRAEECGNWGPRRPGELFLRIYHDVLGTLEDDPLAGMVSPPLMGSSGTCPLTIVSTVPDIVRHFANCIVRAEREVFLATNFWAYGDTTTLVANALKELSRRAGERGQRVVVKVIYDRGNVKQIFDNHQIVPPSEYTGKAVRLPAPEEVPHLDLQVQNYHRPILGTFHAKYVVIDRKIALLTSCNIQETDNLEMMSHFEGPNVDSFYDMALLSWYKALEPPLPSLSAPAATVGGIASSDMAGRQNEGGAEDVKGGPVGGENGHVASAGHEPVSGEQRRSGEEHTERPAGGDEHDTRLPEHTTGDPHYDVDLASEARRVNSVVSAGGGETHMQAVTRHLNTTIQPDTKGNVTDPDPSKRYTPYILHKPHEPFPIAMVCRRPYGAPNNNSIYTPQNEAWLSALRNAKKEVFIQSPTMNAEPLFPAIIDACTRGIQVVCYLTQGYNDAGELLPGQNGTNEMTSHRLYTTLPPAHRANLHIHFYIAFDQTHPLPAKSKKRDSHIKLLIADSRVGIMGNGNQDTQSWFHSQEINVMIDSEQICGEWRAGVEGNQNTGVWGEVGREDGVWRDAQGKEVEGAMGVDPGRFPWAKGVVGAVQRVRGAGGF